MRKFSTRLISTVLIGIMAFSLTGCTNIIQRDKDKYAQIELQDTELKDDVYYIKNGTRFVQVHKCDSATSTDKTENNSRKLMFLLKDYKTIPTLYKGEIIAIATQKDSLDPIAVTRYQSLGYTLGIYGLTKDDDNYYDFNAQSNVVKDSNASDVFDNAFSEKIRVVNISGQPVVDSMLSDTGVLDCLDENGSYSVDYYSGTKYCTSTFTADTFILQEFEYYKLDNIEDSKNGYFSISMPEDAKSGWYYIDGAGMFKYIAAERGTDESTINMNEAYYTDDTSADDVYAQKYSVTLDTDFANVGINLTFDPSGIDNVNSITGKAVSPDGTSYDMELDTENNVISCSLQEAMAGKWTLYVEPKSISITDAEIVSTATQQEITEEDKDFSFSGGESNVLFQADYSGSGDIYGIIVYPDGTTKDMELDDDNYKLTYTIPYMDEGTYTVKIYHYTDTEVSDITATEDSEETNTDEIVSVTE